MSLSASAQGVRTRAVIMTVDDEPEVLSAVERDLRRHFRSDYRVVKAGSGRQALEATVALKEREAPVALFLVDERMPRMSGTEFLREARSIFPDARKVLLTAYADTRAAIMGINDVGLDYYLMKPWDPPEEHLYPVLDELLEAWSASYRPPFRGIRVLGTAWSPESHAVRDFLSRNRRPFQWIDIELDAESARWVDEVSPNQRLLPVVAFPDGPPLVAPTLPELGERIGLQVHATLPHYDAVIAGAGPSGLAAAVYASSEGLRTLIVESDAPGGQAGTSSMIENYPGFPAGIGGAELARRASFQAQRFGTELVSPQDIVALRVEGPTKIVTLSDGTEVGGRVLIVATGMKVRKLDVPGLEAWTGVGVYYGAAVSEAASCAGQDVVIVGGANSAGQAAMLLSRYARTVTMVVRGPSLSVTMSHYLVDRIEASDTIDVLVQSEVTAARGSRVLESLTVTDHRSGAEREIATQYLFIFIGSMPHSEFLAGIVARDERGFVLTGPDLRVEGRLPADWPLERDPYLLETSVPGIFAVGDVRHGSTKRVASAVGEGSAVVGSVHKYLETV
jgi:thioredoxin reductase (NADPH)